MKLYLPKNLFLAFAILLFKFPAICQISSYKSATDNIIVPPSKSGLIIYNQMNEISNGGMLSQEVTDNTGYTSIGADDFIVPAGETWNIRHVAIAGSNSNASGIPVSSVNVFIYSDEIGMPADELFSFLNISSVTQMPLGAGIDKLEITLPTSLDLPAGHYWLAVQVVGGSDALQWYWSEEVGLPIEKEYHWKNPLDGLGTGYIDWTAASIFSWGDFNLSFALFAGGVSNDLAMVSIESPITGAGITSTEVVKVLIKNEGTNPQTNFNLSYSIDGSPSIVENVGALSIEPNQYTTYTFTTPANLAVAGQHIISASTMLTGDLNNNNNEASKSIYNLGTINTMPTTGTSIITTCGATFTDAGGLEGNIGENDIATTTIFPANSGDWVKLTFLNFDVSWGDFSIYNGPDMNSPKIGTWLGTNNPGEVYALNATGALTIHFEGPGWETTPGWVAYISCITPATDDFALSALTCSNPTMFEGDNAVISANIKNFGTLTQSKTVTFKANNVVIGTATSPSLSTGDTAWVNVNFNPTVAGNYHIEASIPHDLGSLPNDTISIEKIVYPFGTFYEDFEGSVFPPENWRHGGSWSQGTQPAVGIFNADCFVDFSSSDTLVSPRLEINQGDILTFSAKTTPWWEGNLDLYWLDEENGVWNYMQTIPLSNFSYSTFNIDMSQAAGINRIGFLVNVTNPFSWVGNVQIDNIIGQGISVHYDNHDLKAKQFIADEFFNVNEPTEFQLVVRNDGLLTTAASDYSIKLFKSGQVPVELSSVQGQDIALNQEITFTLSHTFTSIENLNVYAEVVYAADQYPINNKTQEKAITGLAEGSQIASAGNGLFQVQWPIDFSYKKSLTETIYLNTEINQTGVLYGIQYDYSFEADEVDAPVQIWVGETSQTEVFDWVPATQMTLVFDGKLNVAKGKHTIYIPFTTPFNYADGSKNLAILTQKIGNHYQNNQNYFSYDGSTNRSIGLSSDEIIPDPNSPSGGYPTNLNPNIKFVFNQNSGSVSGIVKGENNVGIQSAEVTINQLGIKTYTDSNGQYQLPYVPHGNFQATAQKYTFLPVSKPLAVTAATNTNLDFTLPLLALLQVNGRVVGDNDPSTGIANATVTLSGYNSYSTVTDASGYFTFTDVYSNNTYSLKATSIGYEDYFGEVQVGSYPQNIGTIVMAELKVIAYGIVAEDKVSKARISWFPPDISAQHEIAYDDSVHENGYAGEPNEEVWLGNYFPIPDLTTISSFDLFWGGYGLNTPQPMRLDIMDENANIIASSAEFISGIDEWVRVDVPNLTLQGNYFVMVHWSGSYSQSSYLAFDTTVTTPNYAYYLYPGGSPEVLSNLVNQQGSFLIHANVMSVSKKNIDNQGSINYIIGFDVYRGLLSDINNASSWPKLNLNSSISMTYEDLTWPPIEPGNYIYAVKALYPFGESELSFSNQLLNIYAGQEEISKPQILMYPNPAHDYVTISNCKDSYLKLFDMQGRVLIERYLESDFEKLDISDLRKGIYIVRIDHNTIQYQHKLIGN